MATSPRPTDVEALEEGKPQNDWEAVLHHVKENPVMWAAAIGFIIVCALAGVFYRMQTARAERSATAELARALKAEEPAERVAALATLAEGDTPVTAEALYLRGETAIEANDDETAKASFESLRAKYPDFAFTPDAVEGLGFIAEENEDYDAAIAHYRDVAASWPDSFAARRQPFNIARAHERAERLEDAIAAYREQLEVFPGSNIAGRAQEALDRLRGTHPDLFESLPAVEGTGLVESLEQSILDSQLPPLTEGELPAIIDEAPAEAAPDANSPAESAPAPGDAAAEESGGSAPEPPAETAPTP